MSRSMKMNNANQKNAGGNKIDKNLLGGVDEFQLHVKTLVSKVKI
jgi:hypothetical protein